MRRFYIFMLLFSVLSLIVLAGCAPTPPRVYRVEPEQEINLSGKWNDTDSQMVSEAMIDSCMSAPWIGEFIQATGTLPVLVVGTIYNKTDEHISIDVFIKDLERTFVETKRARVVQGGAALDELRAIRQGQQSFASPETRRYLRNELGANFVVQGTINKIADIDTNRSVYFYQVNLELLDLETTEKLWIGQKELKKYIEKDYYMF